MIDLNELKLAIRKLERHQKFYKVLKEELIRQDHWKNQQRGNPRKAGKASYEKRHNNTSENF